MRIFVVGASGGIGRLVIERGLARGHSFTGLSRESIRIPHWPRLIAIEGHATDGALLRRELPGHDAVVFALGIDRRGRTTLFSQATRALLGAMRSTGLRRLVAVTGVGTGDTRGRGGFLFDRILFPLFARNRCADKERQESLIAQSDLDWTIVRPAPLVEGMAVEPFQAVTELAPDTVLTRISRPEVADFILGELENPRFIGGLPFIGHRR